MPGGLRRPAPLRGGRHEDGLAAGEPGPALRPGRRLPDADAAAAGAAPETPLLRQDQRHGAGFPVARAAKEGEVRAQGRRRHGDGDVNQEVCLGEVKRDVSRKTFFSHVHVDTYTMSRCCGKLGV